MRAVLLIVLIGLIGAGALYVLSSGGPAGSDSSGIAMTLKDITSRVTSPSAGAGEAAAEPGGEDGNRGALRWFTKGDRQATLSTKEVYYQYVDDSGTVHFVQQLGDVPAKWQDRAGRIEVEKALPIPGKRSAPPAATRRAAAERPAWKPSAREAEVVVYTTTWCGWCRKTLAYLDERGVRYVNKDIEANDWNRDELIEKTGRTSIPVVEIDGEIIRGYNPDRMEQLLARSS